LENILELLKVGNEMFCTFYKGHPMLTLWDCEVTGDTSGKVASIEDKRESKKKAKSTLE
jgi:hypothetical protein